MLQFVHDLLASSPPLRLFAVIGLGYLVGRWRLGGLSLGVAAVLFVGLILGGWDSKAFELPTVLSTVGLTLFVYTLGLSSGPAVYRALTSVEGLKLSLAVIVAIVLAALTTLGCTHWLHLPPSQAAGLFAGSLTNTPAMAAMLEYQQKLALSLGQPVDEGPAVGYALGYPFGILGVFFTLYLLRNWPKLDMEDEKKAFQAKSGQSSGPVFSRNYRVTKLKPNGNQLEADWIREQSGLVVARRLHSGHVDLAEGDSVLAIGDTVLAVGTSEMHAKAAEFLGEAANEHLEEHREVTYRRFFVSNRQIIGKTLGSLDIHIHATITRVRRGDVEFPASPNFVLLGGDVVRVVTAPENIEKLSRYFGDSLEDIADTDFLSIALGLVLGVLAGMLPLPLGASGTNLGVAGGTLLVALVLGKLGRSGSIIWTLSREANLALRHFGLLLFLATVGLRTGGQFQQALSVEGLKLMAAGVLITWTSSFSLALLLRHWLSEDLMTTLGVMAGGHTQPACLAYGEDLVREAGPEFRQGINVGYAAVFPVAMVAKILIGTSLLQMLH